MTESESIIPRIRVSPERKTMQMSQPRELDAKTIPILHAPEPSSPPPLVPGANGESVASRYEIVEKIGVGGMGVVYLARDPQLGRYVAIKRLHQESLSSPSMKRRFLREAKAIAALTHIHIVHVYALGEDNEGPYIIMEYIPGPRESSPEKDPPSPFTLADRVHRDGPLTLNEALDLVIKLAGAVRYAHSCHVIHRDLKPSNVLLDESSEPKVVDFGLARTMLPSEHKLTVPGEKMLSLGYGAPEQEKDASQTDERADVYGLGALLYFSLTGQNPRYFREKDVPEALRLPIVKALETDREKRWNSVDAFSEALLLVQAPTTVELPTTKTTWRCKWCDTINPVQIMYCANCGWNGGEACQECGSETRSGIQFCGNCGADAREYENARQLLNRMRAAREARDFPFVLQHAGQISGFHPLGPKGQELIEQVNATLTDTRRLIERRTRLRDDVRREMDRQNYERAQQSIEELHTLGNGVEFTDELTQIPELIKQRDLRRAQGALESHDWKYAELVANGLLEGVAPDDPTAKSVLRAVAKRKRTVRRRTTVLVAAAALMAYVSSAAPIYRLLSLRPPLVIDVLYQPLRWLHDATVLEAPIQAYAALWQAERMFSPLPPDDATPSRPPLPPAVERLPILIQAYDGAAAKHQVTHEARAQTTDLAYITELKTLQKQMQEEGNFEGWSLVGEALDTFEFDGSIVLPEYDVVPLQLKHLQDHFLSRLDEERLARYRALVALTDDYLSKLRELQKELTKKGKMEAAQAVQDEMNRTESAPLFLEARQAVPSAADSRDEE